MAAGYDGSIRIDTQINEKGFNSGINNITKSLKGLGATLGVAFSVKAAIDLGKAAINIASDIQEVQNVVDTAFGSMADQVEEFASTAIDKFGMSELAAKRTSSTYMAMSKGMGIAGQAAADMAIDVAGLTGDVASFYNVSQEIADTALKSIWTGETESLKQFGVVMTQSNLQQFAYANGIKKKISAMSQAEQVMLRYKYVTKQLGLAQGDFAKTSGSWANQTRILSERWKQLLGLLGSGLIEVGLPIVKALNTILEILIKIFSKIGDIYSALTGKKLVKSNNTIADSANYAADSEFKFADGVEAVGKEIRKQLASFDELNILQKDLANGGGEIGFSPDNLNFGELNTVDNAEKFKGLKNEFEDFFFGVENRYRKLRQELLIPIKIPAPVAEPIKNPVWNPNYGLEEVPTLVPAPNFDPLPNPIWAPNWGLFDSLYAEGEKTYSYSYIWGNRLQESLAHTKAKLIEISTELGLDVKNIFSDFQSETELSTLDWGRRLNNNLAILTENIRVNTETLAQTISLNFEKWRTSSSQSVELWKKDVSQMVYQTATNTLSNVNAFLQSSDASIVNWAKTTGENLQIWGNGIVSIAHETAYNFVDAIVDGLKSAWEKTVEYAKATGEKISGSFSGSFSLPSPGAIGLGVIGTIGTALSLIRKGFVPALATGAVIPPNSEFLAILGDQKQGRNIETPERLLRDIMREELANLGGGNGDMTIIVKIGDETITERVVNNINRQSRISGNTIITV